MVKQWHSLVILIADGHIIETDAYIRELKCASKIKAKMVIANFSSRIEGNQKKINFSFTNYFSTEIDKYIFMQHF